MSLVCDRAPRGVWIETLHKDRGLRGEHAKTWRNLTHELLCLATKEVSPRGRRTMSDWKVEACAEEIRRA